MTQKRSTIVHIDYEEKMSLDNAVSFLETIVNKLKEEGSFTLTHDGNTHHVEPSANVELEVKLEEKSNGKHELELELEWYEGDNKQGQGLQID